MGPTSIRGSVPYDCPRDGDACRRRRRRNGSRIPSGATGGAGGGMITLVCHYNVAYNGAEVLLEVVAWCHPDLPLTEDGP